MNILERILTEKQKEVVSLKKQGWIEPGVQRVTSFYERVQKATSVSIIAEIKRASPSKGDINKEIDPAEQAKQYEKLGAQAISVLTDPTFFCGTMEDLQNVRKAVHLPILCKDFIIDPIQIDWAKSFGANVILLIVAALNDEELKNLYSYAKKQNLEVLVEVHNEKELKRALELKPQLIGINNRNLITFDVDLQTTEKLALFMKNSDTIFISESGIKNNEDVLRVRKAGAKAILVGETLMQSKDLKATFQQLHVPLIRGKGE